MIELLQKLLGESLTEEMVQEIEAYLAANYVAKAEYDQLKNQLESGSAGSADDGSGVSGAASGSVGGSVVGSNGGSDGCGQIVSAASLSEEDLLTIKAEVETQLQVEYEERLAAIEFDYALSLALLKVGVVDPDLVKVKLDMDKLALLENGEISGLEDQVEEIRQQYPMLFVDNAAMLPADFYGLKPMVGQKSYATITREDINNMNYKERLALLKSNPSLYHALVR